MARKDLSSAESAPAPLAPLEPEEMRPARLLALGRRVAKLTWAHGLPRWFWGEGVALLGLGTFGAVADSGDDDRVRRWVDERLLAGLTIEHVNDLAPGTAALAVDPKGSYVEALRPLVTWAVSSPAATRASNGALEHWPGDVWADTMFMAGAFLARFARASGDAALLEAAGRQLVWHAEVLQHPGTGLFAHGTNGGKTIWSYWGRANAWAALAAVEFLEASAATDADTLMRAEIGQRLERQLTTLAQLQPDHGVWDVLVDGVRETSGVVETSAAAGIAAAMLRASRLMPGLAPAVVDAGWRAARGSLAYVDASGALTRVSAGTVLQLLPFGYSVIRNDLVQPWGQGLALLAVVEALRFDTAPTTRKTPPK
ncbi:MAG: glycoside hydrolase family 88 protein [Acidimicrobiales bacterium]